MSPVSELLPVSQAASLRSSLVEYLGTTFSLADPDTRDVLEEFLTAPSTGMFRGPFVRLRLPFRAADDGWRDSLEWHEGFPPYGHQAAAFRRLSSLDLGPGHRGPEPTIVTTGTGSGKTEAFLYPILDHVLRAKRAGVGGTKAIILYPMNALANDQAKRLAGLITRYPALGGVTAALFTGQDGPERSMVNDEGLITSRDAIRDTAPDVLLTNYKMLDQMLLREKDAKIWQQSARSLQYLVLDEFHTYDGAQGTDVAMLLRRLGLALKSHWSDDEPFTAEERERPLGRVTPVATSATLGDKGDPGAMLSFAETVFGVPFGPDAVVTESRLALDEWVGEAAEIVRLRDLRPIAVDHVVARQVVEALDDEAVGAVDPDHLTREVLRRLYRVPPAGAYDTDVVLPDWHLPDLGEADGALLLDLAKAHPLVQRLADAARDAVPLSDLAREVLDRGVGVEGDDDGEPFLSAVLSALSHLRVVNGRRALSLDVHLWVRELTRIDRTASNTASFRWGDDGVVLDAGAEGDDAATPTFPAIYCRHCGRSGWGVALAPTGADLDTEDSGIRERHLRRDERFRPLVHALEEDQRAADGEQVDDLAWLVVQERRLVHQRPDDVSMEQGGVVPVLTHRGEDAGKASADDVCPSCQQPDGIRFLGSAIATLLSVTLSGLFGTEGLSPTEKKALVFTDSVQDAAHRAGFVQARSHALTLRAVLREAIGHGRTDLDSLARTVVELAGDEQDKRYRILAPALADREKFAPFWQKATLPPANSAVRKRVTKRLLLDIELELGLRSGVGRTLELTGSVVAEVEVAPEILLQAARDVLAEGNVQDVLEAFAPTDRELVAWARGVVERMRTRGAIDHGWFTRFRQEDGNRWSITGGRLRAEGMPGFGRGSSAPGFPRIGGGPAAKDSDLDPIGAAQGWYARWATKCLGVERADAPTLARLLFQKLASRDVVGTLISSSGATTYHLAPTSVVVEPAELADLQTGRLRLACDVCRSETPGTVQVVDQLEGCPCLVARCTGRLRRRAVEDNFYRRMYEASDIRRVVAREHTSLLPDDVRLHYEQQFKASEPAADAPNVLVATPTLEMGIDIGDLSAVMLASLPRSVSSYLQRVGRAGRLTGNALALAFVTGRGDQLPRFAEPLSIVNGQVRPPATYLDAEEILQRQYLASVADVLARRPEGPHPKTAAEALGTTEPGSYLGEIIAEAEESSGAHLAAFLGAFPNLRAQVAERLRAWATRDGDLPGTSWLARRCHAASATWLGRVESLNHRVADIQKVMPELEQKARSTAATKDDEREHRTARAALGLARRQLSDLRGEYWVSVLEEFGLFPNYTLLDDSVSLEVALSWVDPDTQEFHNEPLVIERGSSLALRDFAPGATFYARGYAIEIDAVELGRDDEAVRTWACCPDCGYVLDVGETGVQAAAVPPCPRCGSIAITDVDQRLEVVELRAVSSMLRREEAAIDDRRDERNRERFTVLTLADIDPTRVTRQWFVDGYGFGAKHLRDVSIRWLNLGRAAARGSTHVIGGEAVDAPLFRVCAVCGKLDTATGANRASEHRPWCPQRKADTERTTSIALSRTLRTEGLVMRLPTSVTLGDDFALPSLSAALLLALRERIGGAPDHLDVTTVVDPTLSDGGDNHYALLLHDRVPGGTGYLTELADPTIVWHMLRRAWELLRDCSCQQENKLACDRCLLPFASGHLVQRTSRAAAERHLRTILLSGDSGNHGAGGAVDPRQVSIPDDVAWSVTTDEPPAPDPESQLEQRFREVLRERLKTMGATVVEQPTHLGSAWRITLGGGARWRLEPQQYVAGAKPDFVLTSERPDVPDTAIFLDGWLYHASPAVNRIADDAQKRRNLRDHGLQVLALTWTDLDAADSSQASPSRPPWLMPGAREMVLAQAKDQLSPAALAFVETGPLEMLLDWLQDPQPTARERLGKWLPMLVLPSAQHRPVPATGQLSLAARDVLDGLPSPSTTAVGGVWRSGAVALAVRMVELATSTFEVAVVLDDSEDAVADESHKAAWREWLRLSNLLGPRLDATVITSRTALVEGRPEPSPTDVVVPVADLHAAVPSGHPWHEVYVEALDHERELLAALADLAGDGVGTPSLGHETADGVPLSLAWPELHVTAMHDDLTDGDVADIETEGWVVVAADAGALRTALTRGND